MNKPGTIKWHAQLCTAGTSRERMQSVRWNVCDQSAEDEIPVAFEQALIEYVCDT